MAGRPGKRLKQVQQFIRDAEQLANEVGNITVQMFVDPVVKNSRSDCWWDAVACTQDTVRSLERLLVELQKGAKGGKESQDVEPEGDDAAGEDVRGGISSAPALSA